MPTLRNRQKVQRTEAILQAGDKLFRSKGFTKTSIEDIATEANLSPATIYNYFGTKFNLLYALIEPEMARVEEEASLVLSNLPEDPVRGITELARCYEIGPDWRNRKMLLPFAKDFFLVRNHKKNPFDTINHARSKSFQALFEFYKSCGKISPSMDEDDAIAIISSLFQYHLKSIIFGGDSKADITTPRISNLERRIRFAFSGITEISGSN